MTDRKDTFELSMNIAHGINTPIMQGLIWFHTQCNPDSGNRLDMQM